ncbi:uncharacterized protein EHS24_000491 [Apiotrichum porosum]|uniref:CID domain-containing protein n=1 Tax=Apiotrichum porosum TaxID=105984 RepID=A0A427YA49_9TREE|nr:uncharacterized protein EHS24_000491 [Apiotrichum porosum]RSH87968.1 hypothetical protein EHS24_000491 [Apiotrichum porosum]
MADLKVRTGRVPHRQSTDQQAFDDLLDKTVRAPRLSGSKIKELSDSALRLVANDHHLVTSLLRLNTSLPTASTSRISSLYVFDAIARAAKSQVDKGNGRTPSTVRGQGTNAGLLAKMEGVVESWVAGMVDDGKGGVWSEGRDKTRKIIEIWRKGSTFPEACISQLAQRIAEADGGAAGPSKSVRSTTPISAPPAHLLARYGTSAKVSPAGSPALANAQPSAPAGQLPPEIMALLGVKSAAESAAEAKASTSSAIDAVLANVRNAPASALAPPAAAAPALDPAQLAALANLGTLSSLAVPPTASATPTPPMPLPPHGAASLPPRPTLPPLPANGDRYGNTNGHGNGSGSSYDDRNRRRSRSPENRYSRDPRDRDPRDRDPRDRDPRDRRVEFRERDSSRERRDYGDRRDDRRDSRDSRDSRDFRDRDRRDDRRDDRERDYPDRRGSSDRDHRSDFRAPLPPKPTDLPARPAGLPSRPSEPHQQHSQVQATAMSPTPVNAALGGAATATGGGGGGGSGAATLATFDMASFNPTQPESWAALAAAWHGSTGREPNQIELMQFLATGQVPDAMGMGMMGGGMGMMMGGGGGAGGMGGGMGMGMGGGHNTNGF